MSNRYLHVWIDFDNHFAYLPFLQKIDNQPYLYPNNFVWNLFYFTPQLHSFELWNLEILVTEFKLQLTTIKNWTQIKSTEWEKKYNLAHPRSLTASLVIHPYIFISHWPVLGGIKPFHTTFIIPFQIGQKDLIRARPVLKSLEDESNGRLT